MKQYPSYKDSGIEWLGEIPEGWETKKVKHTTYVKGRIGWQGLKSDEFIEKGPFLVTGTDFKEGKVNWETCYHVSEKRYNEDPYIQLRENDLLITKDGTIGKTAIVKNIPDNACLNSGIFLTRPMSGDYLTEFMYWLLNSLVFTKFIDYIKTGTTINHLYQNVFVSFAFLIPPLSEQRAIADFLDRETGRIDKLIEKKERQIELLKEKRATLISHAVTKGLDPDVPMKDSGIEWLGEIPEGWNYSKIIYYSKLKTGGTPSRDNQEYWESGNINWMVSGEVNKQHVYETHNKITMKGLKNSNANLLPVDTVMIALNGQGKTKGTVAISKIETTCNQSLAGFVCDKTKLHYNYLFYFLHAKYKEIRGLVGDDLRDGLSLNLLKTLYSPLPPIPEQRAIASFLDRETGRIDKLSAKVQESIEKLREYRTALISAAVTGKIDVREEVLS